MNPNQKGLTSLNFALLFFPIFLFVMLMMTSFQLIDFYSKTQKICRNQILLAQKYLGKNLERLIALNRQASTLRSEEAKLKATIASLAAVPPAAAPFVKLLKINQFRQGVLRGRQEMLISSAKHAARSEIQRFKTAVAPGVRARDSKVRLMVLKKPTSAIAPSFYPATNFEDLQTISIRWKVLLSDVVSNPLFQFFKNASRFLIGQCAATLIPKGESWNPKLTTAKY